MHTMATRTTIRWVNDGSVTKLGSLIDAGCSTGGFLDGS